MSSKQLGLRILAVVIMVTILAGCTNTTATPTQVTAPTNAPTGISQPTLDLVKTQVAQTIIANLTQSAPSATPNLPTNTPLPTYTPLPTTAPLPTDTPVPTLKPTATFIPWTSTPIYTATLTTYNCSVTDVSPKSTDTIKTGVDFDGKWVAKNTGSKSWLAADVDLKYISGTKFQTKGDIYDSKSDTASGSSYTAIVDMVAPSSAGTYTATWALVRSGVNICTLNLKVVVVK